MNDKPLRVFSFGGGWQSVGALVLQIQGKLKTPYDVFVYADVGADSEKQSTITYIEDIVKPACLENGIEFIHTFKTRFGERDTVYQAAMRKNRSIPIPVKLKSGAYSNRICTADFKIKVVDKWLKSQKCERAIIGLGFTIDEQRRADNKPKGWHESHGKRKFGFSKMYNYPLLDLGLSRFDMEPIIRNHGWPMPESSACWFCPFSPRSHWIEMRKNDVNLFESAIEIQDFVNEKRGYLGKDRVSIHRDGIDLREVPLQQSLWDDFMDTDESCHEGYCGL